MIAEGRVAPDQVEYNDLPWKYSAGTPEHPGRHRLRAGAAVRRRSDGDPGGGTYFRYNFPVPPAAVIGDHGRDRRTHRRLTAPRMGLLSDVPGLTIYGPPVAERRPRWWRSTSPGGTRLARAGGIRQRRLGAD